MSSRLTSLSVKPPGTAILIGYYGMQNTGDDAFLAVAAAAARKHLRSDSIFARSYRVPTVSGVEVRPLFPFPPLRGLGRLNSFPEHFRLRRARHLIWAGGSIIHTDSINEGYCRILDLAREAKGFAAGVSVGPFTNTSAESSAARFLTRLDFVGVRDQISYQRVREIAPKAHVRLTFDLAPLLMRETSNRTGGTLPARRGLGVALCNYERFVGGDLKRERDRLTVVAEAIRTCARAGAVDHVVLIDFNGHPQFGDDAIHAELAHRLENCVSTERVRYCDDPVAVMRRIATLRGMLAMRLHAAIFAFCTSVPAVLLSYHEKCREWARMVGAPMDQTMDTGQMDPTVLVSQIKALSKSEPPLSAMKPVEAVGRAIENWSWCS